uniref:Major facilitator superfamily (MFS) profile domain-containing protein n=1 Tax=Arcella intermedia TaxID=1963864 RepID=A0A6B2L3H4_9EUKA
MSRSPRELWLCYLNKVLFSFSFFTWSIIMVIYLNELGFSDEHSGFLYGVYGAFTSIYGLVTGFFLDRYGVRISLVIGGLVCGLGKLLLAANGSSSAVYFSLCFVLPVGEALCMPVLTTGIRRYTLKENAALAYGIYYSILNIGAALSGYIVDLVRSMGDSLGAVTVFENHITVYRLLTYSCAVANFIPVGIAFFLVREIDVTASVDEEKDDDKKEKDNLLISLSGTCKSKAFWKFMLLNLLLMNVRSIFKHMDATLPKFLQRRFGDDVGFGTIYSINPLIVVFLAPVIQILISKYPPLPCIIIGAWISSLSPLWIWWNPSMVAVILFVVQLSIGESIWSPRNLDYMMKIIPKGKEGIYMSLCSFPMFASKLPTGILSGWLLAEYCPTSAQCSGTIWLLIGLLTILSPVFLTFCVSCIEEPSEQNQRDFEKLSESWSQNDPQIDLPKDNT